MSDSYQSLQLNFIEDSQSLHMSSLSGEGAPHPCFQAIFSGCSVDGGFSKYSTITGSTPWARSSSKVWRDLEHRGLWNMVTFVMIQPTLVVQKLCYVVNFILVYFTK